MKKIITTILNKTRKSSERFTLISVGMGCAGDPPDYPTHKFSIATGVDRGNGYRGRSSLTHFLTENREAPQAAKDKLIALLKQAGYTRYLRDLGLIEGKPVTGKHSHKVYRCTECGTEELHGTNHWGEIYPYCQRCVKVTVWNCQEPLPEGYGTPKPWKMARLGDIAEIIPGKAPGK